MLWNKPVIYILVFKLVNTKISLKLLKKQYYLPPNFLDQVLGTIGLLVSVCLSFKSVRVSCPGHISYKDRQNSF